MSATAIAHLEAVSLSLARKPVLKAVSCSIPTGRVVAVVGESGSGKSTLLQMLNGLLVPDAGQVTLLGERLPVADPWQLRQKIGFAVQDAALMPHLSLFDNLTLMARLNRWSNEADIRSRFEKLMQLLEMDVSLAGQYPYQLSGGQRQRASLGRAFMLKPPLLLLDEPFSAVDPITRLDIYSRFEALLASEPATVVMVTHDLKEAQRLASHIIVLKDGQIAQADELEAVRLRPANDYVARLFKAGLS